MANGKEDKRTLGNVPEFSVVVPTYNSAEVLSQLCEQLDAAFSAIGAQYEILIVNDNSRDSTCQTVEKIIASNKYNVELFNLGKNVGQHRALLHGFRFSRGKFIITIDDDMQFMPKDISLLIKQQAVRDADIVYGVTNHRKHSAIRNIGSRISLLFFNFFLSTALQGTSFRLIKAEHAKAILYTERKKIFIDALITKSDTHIDYVAVNHCERKIGKSGHSIFKLSLWTIAILYEYSTLARIMIVSIGLLLGVLMCGLVLNQLHMLVSLYPKPRF